MTIGEHCTLLLGDCKQILPHLSGVDAIVTDPPYGIGWNTDYRRFSNNGNDRRHKHKPIAGDGEPFDPAHVLGFRRVVLFGANCFSNRLPLGSWLVWDKRFANGKSWLADGEVAWINKGHGIYIRSVTSQGCVFPDGKRVHPTQKPIAIMEWLIEKATEPGQLVVDPYMGSGTTAIAAMRTGRRFIGIEIDREHFKRAAQRIADEVAAQHIDS